MNKRGNLGGPLWEPDPTAELEWSLTNEMLPVGDMLEAPSPTQWKALFEVAKAIWELAPWSFLRDTDLLTVQLPEYEELIFCSVLGNGEDTKGMVFYLGSEGLSGLNRLQECDDNVSAIIHICELQCLACHFGSKEEVTDEEMALYKSLGLKVQSKNTWPLFRSMKPGYLPWKIDAKEADLMLGIMQNLYIACQHVQTGKVEAKFNEGETVLRSFSPEEELWSTVVAQIPEVSREIPPFIVEDELLIARLKKKRRKQRMLEWDMTYVPIPLKANANGRPLCPLTLFMVDVQDEEPVDQDVAVSNEGIEQVIIDMMTRYIMKNGRPNTIFVRSQWIGRYLADFCAKLDIVLSWEDGVPIIDEIMEQAEDDDGFGFDFNLDWE